MTVSFLPSPATNACKYLSIIDLLLTSACGFRSLHNLVDFIRDLLGVDDQMFVFPIVFLSCPQALPKNVANIVISSIYLGHWPTYVG